MPLPVSSFVTIILLILPSFSRKYFPKIVASWEKKIEKKKKSWQFILEETHCSWWVTWISFKYHNSGYTCRSDIRFSEAYSNWKGFSDYITFCLNFKDVIFRVFSSQ